MRSWFGWNLIHKMRFVIYLIILARINSVVDVMTSLQQSGIVVVGCLLLVRFFLDVYQVASDFLLRK